MIIFVGRGQRRKFIIYEDFMAKKVKTGKFFAKHKLYLYNKAHSMFVCLSGSVLAIFMDRFWNQGYLWTPHDPGMTRKI